MNGQELKGKTPQEYLPENLSLVSEEFSRYCVLKFFFSIAFSLFYGFF